MKGAGAKQVVEDDPSAWLALVVRSMLGTWRTLARTSRAEMIRDDRVLAVRTPTVPERSVFNSVGYTDPGALLDAYEDLRLAYEESGCAWTVWVPERDVEVAGALASRDHVLDATPRAMGMSLNRVSEPDLEGIDWTRDGTVAEGCMINDRAYGYRDGTWTQFNDERASELRTYVARVDGQPASTVATLALDGDCEIWSVATLGSARGRGVSTALMRQALWDAKKEGLSTATLQATKLGRPVYERVGFADFGALQMWELRSPGDG